MTHEGGFPYTPAHLERDPIIPHPLSFILAVLAAIALGGCGPAAKRDAGTTPTHGGYYLDDGPGANPPADIDSIPDAVPRPEPIRAATCEPYVVMGRSYTPMRRLGPYKARGIASWYGRRYHGRPTSSGEIYDMYAMTAAHSTLPIPSYARVTNLANGRTVVVRINDRGPFVNDRLIDLSYTAAHKLGMLAGGSARVEVETIIAGGAGATAASAPRDPAPPVARPESPVPVATAPAAQIPVTAETAGFFLQLGAFGSKDNAENFLARIKAQMAGMVDGLHVYLRDGLFRVHAGPYASDAEARQAADRIAQTLGVRPFVRTW
ncbi:MAG: septal ring lytic transglycosylase RlpA family protein [Thermodesulfobacteriota bacterium]